MCRQKFFTNTVDTHRELSFFGLSDPETFESDLCDVLRSAFAMAGFGAALDTYPQINNIVDLTGYLDYLRG